MQRAVILLLTSIIFLSGCEQVRLARDLRRVMKSTIALPDNTAKAFMGDVSPIDSTLSVCPKMIIYIDSTECSMCRLSRLEIYAPTYELSKATHAFEFVLLVSEQEVQGMNASRVIADMEYEIPVYVDMQNTFLRDNPSLQADSRLHSILVEADGTPVFAGDPGNNPAVFEMLKKYSTTRTADRIR